MAEKSQLLTANLPAKMEKEREGKAACKSNEIMGTPARQILAAATPKASEGEQANIK